MVHSSLRRVAKLMLALCGGAFLIFGQTETGQITGTVTDPTGATVPGANVRVVSTSTGAERTTTSSGAGDFAVTNLLPGQYDLTVGASGFETYKQAIIVTVGQRTGVDVKLQIGQTGTTVQVSESTVPVNIETQTLSTTISTTQLNELPTLTRNPYSLVAVSGNVSDAGAGTRGVGFAINGQRESSTNVLLDGAANNNEFLANVGQSVPLDSIQEFSVLTNNFTAEYGRATGGVVNVVTKSGTNDFHGTAYEFNRVSDLSSNSFFNNANTLPKSVFTRNQFGYSFGGPVKKDKLFFFSSTEWIRVRSLDYQTALVPSSQLIAASAPSTQAFFSTYGGLAAGSSVLGSYSINQLNAASGSDVCGGAPLCSALNPNMPLFNKVGYTLAADAGGGPPQNHYMNVERVDWNYSDRTQVYFRYALESIDYFPGYESASPYAGFNTGETDLNNNGLVSLTHTFSPTFVSQSKAVINRLQAVDPLGSPGVVPTMYVAQNTNNPSYFGSELLFPGYYPATPGSGGYFGGPQNYLQLYQDFSWTHGKHEFRFGGSFDYEQDNRTYGAYETASEYLTSSGESYLDSLLSGTLYGFLVAINPQDHYPGQSVPLPIGPPDFNRSNRYREGAAYVQDAWKVTPRLTLNLGLRWEYFGVQHNQNGAIDSNFVTPPSAGLTPASITGGSPQPVDSSPIGGLWKPNYHNFAPRLGFAWDVLGDGKTSIRGGYGIAYERNFGNVTFNVIQNPPFYQTAEVFGVPVSNDNYGPFSGTTGTLPLPAAEARYVNNNIKTAYSHLWSLSLEHQITNGFVVGVDYTGSKGVNLYDLSDVNGTGFGNAFGGISCSVAAGDCGARLNPDYTIIFRRSNGAFSLYNGVNFRASMNNVWHTGVTLTANYTWSHAIDNLSSTFSDTPTAGDGGVYLTPNSGYDVTGLLDPFSTTGVIGKGSSDFDIRQRLSVSAVWAIPAFKNGTGFAHQVFGGWELAPLFTARTGNPYTIFDCTNAATFCPYAGFTGSPGTSNSNGPSVGADTFAYMPLSNIDHYSNPLYGFSDLPPYPPDMSGRNAFTSPGFWELDMGLYKTFSLTERLKLQLRGEAYNIFNHANEYVIGSATDVSSTDVITACRACTNTPTDRRNIQLAAKIIF